MFDGEAAAGPVPTLFSEDPEASIRAIKANLPKAHHDMQKLAKIFMAGETVRLSDCQAILKKPRYNSQKILSLILESLQNQ